MSEWISVKERLPNGYQKVLAFVGGIVYVVAILDTRANKWRVMWDLDVIDDEVTHWMPLPEPPKEDD